MPIIDSRAAERLQPELLSGETIYWAAMPSPNKVFDSDDWAMIPFSFLCGGFAIFWEAGVLGYWQTVQSFMAFYLHGNLGHSSSSVST